MEALDLRALEREAEVAARRALVLFLVGVIAAGIRPASPRPLPERPRLRVITKSR